MISIITTINISLQEKLAETHVIIEDCESVAIDDRQICNELQDASKVMEKSPLDPCTNDNMVCEVECSRNCQEEVRC